MLVLPFFSSFAQLQCDRTVVGVAFAASTFAFGTLFTTGTPTATPTSASVHKGLIWLSSADHLHCPQNWAFKKKVKEIGEKDGQKVIGDAVLGSVPQCQLVRMLWTAHPPEHGYRAKEVDGSWKFCHWG